MLTLETSTVASAMVEQVNLHPSINSCALETLQTLSAEGPTRHTHDVVKGVARGARCIRCDVWSSVSVILSFTWRALTSSFSRLLIGMSQQQQSQMSLSADVNDMKLITVPA